MANSEMEMTPLRRVETTFSFGDDSELANIAYNDKYVLVFDFSKIGE